MINAVATRFSAQCLGSLIWIFVRDISFVILTYVCYLILGLDADVAAEEVYLPSELHIFN